MDDTATGAGDLGDPMGSTGLTGNTDLAEPGHLAELPRSLAAVTTARDGDLVEHALRLSPGATAAEVTAAMIVMPPTAALVGQRGGGDVTLVFQEPARSE